MLEESVNTVVEKLDVMAEKMKKTIVSATPFAPPSLSLIMLLSCYQLNERDVLVSQHQKLVAEKRALHERGSSNRSLMVSEQRKANELAQGLKEMTEKAHNMKREVQSLGQEKSDLEKRMRSMTELTSSSFAVRRSVAVLLAITFDFPWNPRKQRQSRSYGRRSRSTITTCMSVSGI
jgi:hypothetical protein